MSPSHTLYPVIDQHVIDEAMRTARLQRSAAIWKLVGVTIPDAANDRGSEGHARVSVHRVSDRRAA